MKNEDAYIGVTSKKSIAVLPFVNMSGDAENEYFSDGITEEIINALTTIENLKVIARTSSFAFKNKHIDVREIGRKLGVKIILEGSVRKFNNRVRITAQLIRTDDGSHFWARNFDREMQDIFALQDEVSLLIADQIRENFGHINIQDHLIETPTQNIEAYNLYLKGRYHQLKWNAEDLLLAVEYYQQSIHLDPSFALPYFGAALSCGINASWGFTPYQEGIQKAEYLLKEGLKINTQDYLGYFAQATVHFWGKWNFDAGHQFFKKAMALNPSFTDIEEGLAELYTAIGAFEQAMVHTRNILSYNPLSPNHYYTEGNIHYLSGDYEQAINSLAHALKVNPQFSLAIELTAVCYILLKDSHRLEAFLEKYPTKAQPQKSRALFHLMHPKAGESVNKRSVEKLLGNEQSFHLVAWDLYLHIYMGNHTKALAILENGIRMKAGQVINFKHDPLLAPLHTYDRFKQWVADVFHPSVMPKPDVSEAVAVASATPFISNSEVEEYLTAMHNQLHNQQLFLDSGLCLKMLAEKMNLHPNKLSWLINEHVGKNFNDYINTFRLVAFKEKALNPANAHLTLLGLAYESGFNSKSVFNAFFKKMEGMTPRDWVKASKKKA